MWVDFIEAHAIRTPDRPALVVEETGRTLTYGDLFKDISGLAQSLAEVGVDKGDRVALLAQNRLEHLTLFFACARLGAIFVPLNHRLAEQEIRLQLNCLGAKLFLCDHAFPGSQPIETFEPGSEIYWPQTPVSMEDTLLMLLASGSTGEPKGVMLHAGMLLWNAINTHLGWDLRSDDVSPVHMPFFHTGGYNVTCLPLLRLGGKVILTRSFDPASMLGTIERERVTVFFAVPAMFRMMMETPEFSQKDLSSIRFCISGGAPCPASLIDAWRARGLPMKQGFGLTEAGPNCFYLSDEDAKLRQDSVGRPMLHSHLRLVSEKGEVVAPGAIGELVIKGPHVCKGYWRNDAAFYSACVDGFFHTGDLMTRDENGFFYVVGRKKEMYISGGENVYPGEVERQLVQHPQVGDAAVLAVPNEKWGEVGFAFLRTHQQLSLEEVRIFLDSRLSRYKHPLHLVCMEQFPLLANNKVDRKALQAIANEGVGIG